MIFVSFQAQTLKSKVSLSLYLNIRAFIMPDFQALTKLVKMKGKGCLNAKNQCFYMFNFFTSINSEKMRLGVCSKCVKQVMGQ